MPPPVTPRSFKESPAPKARRGSQGLLLVEAILAALVIGTSLVFITRGLSTQLRTLQSIQDYDLLMALARGRLVELEAERITKAADATLLISEGNFESHPDFEWTLTGQRLDPSDEQSPVAITLTVRRSGGEAFGQAMSSSQVQLRAIWPPDWVPEEALARS